jgi:hypothetical protein
VRKRLPENQYSSFYASLLTWRSINFRILCCCLRKSTVNSECSLFWFLYLITWPSCLLGTHSARRQLLVYTSSRFAQLRCEGNFRWLNRIEYFVIVGLSSAFLSSCFFLLAFTTHLAV